MGVVLSVIAHSDAQFCLLLHPYSLTPPKSQKFNRLGRSSRRRKPRRNRSSRTSRPISSWTVGEVKDGLATMWNAAQSAVSIFNTEVRMYDNPFVAAPASNAGTVYACTRMPQGDNYNNREGLSIRTLQTDISFMITWNAANQLTSLRLILFQDFNCLGQDPAPTDLLENADVNSLFSHLSGERMKVIMDQTFVGEDTRILLPVRKTFDLPGHIQFRDATSNATCQGNGSLFLLCITTANANFPIVDGYVRTYFVDN